MARHALLLILVVVTACQSSIQNPNLGDFYNRAAEYHGPERRPVIVIPGVLGSRLVDPDSGRIVWGAFGGEYADPEKPDGARLIALPMAQGRSLANLHDNAAVAGALDRLDVTVFGINISLSAYANLLVSLGAGGYQDQDLGDAGVIDYGTDHYTCFQFPYDWRRDNVENARALKQFILDKRKFIEEQNRKRGIKNTEPIKFDIIAHSMGGLVTRYFLRYGDAEPTGDQPPALTWDGAQYVHRAILIGTPNAGSAEALQQLVNGVSFSRLFSPYSPTILGTMPSLYQLLHRPRHVQGELGDFLDPATWDQHGWGLANPSDEDLAMLLPGVADPAERRRIARDHLEKCLMRARAFHKALDRPARPPEGTELMLFAGDAVDTVLHLKPGKKGLEPAAWAKGDGTVTRYSALMDERINGGWAPVLRSPVHWSRVQFLFEDHLGLTKAPTFTDNLLYLLLEEPR